ncbi:hypothetical protein [Citrobacter phage Tr1]|nr:hypothetical protein [Citrobacter phage Tr1]
MLLHFYIPKSENCLNKLGKILKSLDFGFGNL